MFYWVDSTEWSVSYFVTGGPGSVLKNKGGSLDRSLIVDRQMDPGDLVLSSSSSKTLIFSGLRCKPVTPKTEYTSGEGQVAIHWKPVDTLK